MCFECCAEGDDVFVAAHTALLAAVLAASTTHMGMLLLHLFSAAAWRQAPCITEHSAPGLPDPLLQGLLLTQVHLAHHTILLRFNVHLSFCLSDNVKAAAT